jgi:hypothetical protein
VHLEFKEAGAEERESCPVSSLRQFEEDEGGNRPISGAKQVFAGVQLRPRSLLQPLLPHLIPASGQTNPLRFRTLLPHSKDHVCDPAYIKESDFWA